MNVIKALQILDLSVSNVTLEDIKKAYRLKCREHHPDLGGTQEQMIKINEAKAVLDKQIALYGRVKVTSFSNKMYVPNRSDIKIRHKGSIFNIEDY